MRHSKRSRRGRTRGGSGGEFADALFERALLGESPADGGGAAGRGFDARADRKTLQLCRQVGRALAMALAGECADDVLRDVYVDSVVPLGGAGQLCVTVVLPAHGDAAPADVQSRLAGHTPRLRAAVAREICRKRVPNLSFVVVPAAAPAAAPHEGREGGGDGA